MPSIMAAGTGKRILRAEYLAVAVILLVAAILGLITPAYVGISDGQVSKLVALPAAMLFGLMLLYDRRLSLMVIILFRSSADNVLDLTRLSIGSYPLGVGALINGCVIMIAILLVFEKPKQAPAWAFGAWVPFLAVSLFGVVVSPVKGDALRAFLAILSYTAMFIAGFHCVRNKEEFRKCIKLAVWSSLVPVLYSAVDLGMHHAEAGYRVRSTFNHPNLLAFYTTVMIGLAFYLLKSLPKKAPIAHKICLSVYLVALLGVLALTQTRSAWGATAISFALYAVFFERRYLIYMCVLGALALMIPGVLDRFTDLEQGNTVTTYANLNSFAWRVYLWQCALDWMRPASYLLGNGFNSFKEYSQQFFPLAGTTKWGAHSVYVQLMFELGLAGLATFCWLFFRVFKGLWQLVRMDALAAFSLILIVLNFLICCFSDNMLDYLSYAWYLWFTAGAGCMLARLPGAGSRVK